VNADAVETDHMRVSDGRRARGLEREDVSGFGWRGGSSGFHAGPLPLWSDKPVLGTQSEHAFAEKDKDSDR